MSSATKGVATEIHGSFEFRFSRFSSLDATPGAAFLSESVSLGDSSVWALLIYPGGSSQKVRDRVSCFLVNQTHATVVGSFTLRYKLANDVDLPTKCTVSKRALKNEEVCGYHKFIPKVLLPQVLVDDCLVVFCDLIVYAPSLVSSCYIDLRGTVLGYSAADNSIKHCLAQLQADTASCDVQLRGDGDTEQPVRAHRLILGMRSPVLRELLHAQGPQSIAPPPEATADAVTLPGMPPPVLAEFLRFLYTDECSVAQLSSQAHALLAAACQYQVPALERLCCQYLVSTLNTENVVSILNLGEEQRCEALKASALEFIARHAKELVERPGFFEGISGGVWQEVIRVMAGAKA
jgi:hypothetical protein